jgi:hypothetical protein
MEIRVYDKKISRTITLALTASVLAAFSTFLVITPHHETRLPPEAYPILILPVGMTLVALALINMLTNAQTRIERPTGEVFRLDFLFGIEVRRQRFSLIDFDRVSLSRGYRAGYKVSLVGRDHDLTILITDNLASARGRAEEVAAACGLKVSDQL